MARFLFLSAIAMHALARLAALTGILLSSTSGLAFSMHESWKRREAVGDATQSRLQARLWQAILGAVFFSLSDIARREGFELIVLYFTERTPSLRFTACSFRLDARSGAPDGSTRPFRMQRRVGEVWESSWVAACEEHLSPSQALFVVVVERERSS